MQWLRKWNISKISGFNFSSIFYHQTECHCFSFFSSVCVHQGVSVKYNRHEYSMLIAYSATVVFFYLDAQISHDAS